MHGRTGADAEMPVKCKNAPVFVGISLQTILLSVLPERQLYAKALCAMEGFLGIGGLQEELCFASSGRASLTMLFLYLRKRQEKPISTVLLPDYICNVVCASAEHAGLKTRFYETSDYCPCMQSVKELLTECDSACVLFASLMGHCCEHDVLYAAVRSQHPQVPIIFDECQNLPGFRGALPISMHEDIYCVISFNNKMTQGLLGGAVYGLPQENWEFEPQTAAVRRRMQWNMRASYIKQATKTLREYMTGRYHAPEDEEMSTCEGKYSVAPLRIYKVSLAAACLGLLNWAHHESLLKRNEKSLLQDNEMVHKVNVGNNPLPLYIPIIRNDSFIGRYPLKGKYWTKSPCPQYQNQMYIVAHNTIEVRNT